MENLIVDSSKTSWKHSIECNPIAKWHQIWLCRPHTYCIYRIFDTLSVVCLY